METEYEFRCPLPNGLHARPASLLARVASACAAEVTLTNLRSGAVANAKSILALVAADVRMDDRCRLRFSGAEAARAREALKRFVEDVLPSCDESLPELAPVDEVPLPRLLRDAGVRRHAATIICPGIGQGIVLFLGGAQLPFELVETAGESAAEESRKAEAAIELVAKSLETELESAAGAAEAGILRAHLSIATDVGLRGAIAEGTAAGRSAALAIRDAVESFAASLRAAGSRYVRERAIDVEDVGLELLERLGCATARCASLELSKPSVVAADDLTPRQLLGLDRRFLKALVLARAGRTSHAMILARSFGIPTLTDVSELRSILTSGREAIVDANLGLLVPEISERVRRHYQRDRRRLELRQSRLATSASGSASTLDGTRLEVAANVGTAEEVAPAFARGADAIGLFRTEMLYLEREEAPGEEEQVAIYARAARDSGGRAVLVRTFDLGGDKPVPYLRWPREANPFLGRRGVRVYPQENAMLRTQLRAILRASTAGDLAILLPMVAGLEEIRDVRREIASVRAELAAAGIATAPRLRVGAMIEVPSAAFLVDRLAAEVDFLSIGTNDLLQYFVAADRGSEELGSLYRARHPAFLRLLSKVAGDARRHGLWVGLCGEMAGDLASLPLLLGLGLDEISTAAPVIPGVKAAIARESSAECRSLLEAAMACDGAADVDELVAAHAQRVATGELLHADLVAVDCAARSKEEAIEELVDAIYVAGRTDRPGDLEDAVLAREAVYSTGLGHGFAIPHCKSDSMATGSIAVAKLREPVEWGSVDGEPVSCVILLALRESDAGAAHLKVFSSLARRLMHEEFRDRLRSAESRDDVARCLAAELGLHSNGL